ncbi:hypothetical protein IG631_06968 [Alternaria alternata]|nr:hypothetical protein IG631_06968 [Alternaria alternata]
MDCSFTAVTLPPSAHFNSTVGGRFLVSFQVGPSARAAGDVIPEAWSNPQPVPPALLQPRCLSPSLRLSTTPSVLQSRTTQPASLSQCLSR